MSKASEQYSKDLRSTIAAPSLIPIHAVKLTPGAASGIADELDRLSALDKRMGLFEIGPFISHAGLELAFKIECDRLTQDDILCLASVIASKIKFSQVHGIPRGGVRLMNALTPFCVSDQDSRTLLIVDDVYTTGTSMEDAWNKFAYQSNIIGVVLFARAPTPNWIYPVFSLGSMFQDGRRV